VRDNQLKAYRLVASSGKSWEMREPINLNPLTLRPPVRSDDMHSRPLAYLVEGPFTSFFAGKPIPIRTIEQKAEGDQKAKEDEVPPAAAAPPPIDTSKIERKGQFVSKGKSGRIFIMASSDMLKDVVIDETGRGANSVFALNVIDYLNGRESVAVMRAKEQKFNPLEETSAGAKTFIKSFNIAGLPLLVGILGIGAWFHRLGRKKRIRAMFDS
jgi:hypothetical protein